VNPTVALAHERGLMQRNALYYFDRHELQTFTFSAGTRNKSLESITHGQLPKFLLLAMVNQAAFNGSTRHNPFWFQSFGLNSMSLFVNGEPVMGQPLEPQQHHSSEFLHLVRSLRGKLCMTYDEFRYNNYLLAFDLSPSGSEAHQWFGYRQGQLRLDIRFANAIDHPITLICMAVYDSCMEITKERDVLLDYRKG
jgi:hypothetical protein